MRELKINGLVVHISETGDNHRILTILTANGAIQAIAYCAKRGKSPLLAAAQYFCYCEFLLKEGKGELLYIKEADLIENFYKLRESVEKLEAAAEICKFACKILPEGVSSGMPLKLILNTLYLLQSKNNEIDIKNICILKLMHILGELEVNDEITNYIANAEMKKLYSVELSRNTSEYIDKLVKNIMIV